MNPATIYWAVAIGCEPKITEEMIMVVREIRPIETERERELRVGILALRDQLAQVLARAEKAEQINANWSDTASRMEAERRQKVKELTAERDGAR